MITIVVSGSMEEVFAHVDEFPPAIFVVCRGTGLGLLLIRHCLVKNPERC